MRPTAEGVGVKAGGCVGVVALAFRRLRGVCGVLSLLAGIVAVEVLALDADLDGGGIGGPSGARFVAAVVRLRLVGF